LGINRVKILYEGQAVDAEELAFTSQTSSTMTCEISDGAKIEIKQAIAGVYRLCDRKSPEGKPIYLLVGKLDVKEISPPTKG
jgi:hypothetical protein